MIEPSQGSDLLRVIEAVAGNPLAGHSQPTVKVSGRWDGEEWRDSRRRVLRESRNGSHHAGTSEGYRVHDGTDVLHMLQKVSHLFLGPHMVEPWMQAPVDEGGAASPKAKVAIRLPASGNA